MTQMTWIVNPHVQSNLQVAHAVRNLAVPSGAIVSSNVLSTQRRNFWRWYRRADRRTGRDWYGERWEHFLQRFRAKQDPIIRRHILYHRWNRRLDYGRPWYGWSWGWTRQWSGSADSWEQRWRAKLERLRQLQNERFDKQLAEFRKLIETDPYDFLFGRSNEWLSRRPGEHQGQAAQHEKFESRRDGTVIDVTAVSKKRSADSSRSSENVQTSAQGSEEQPMQYDPITGRMVPRSQADAASNTAHSIRTDSGNSPAESRHSDTAHSKAFETKKSEQTRVEETEKKQGVFHMAGPEDARENRGQANDNSIVNRASATSSAESGTTSKADKSKLEYNPQETTEDDVDLLRASDIRASYFSGKTKQEIADEKKATREALERDFDSYKEPEVIDVGELRAKARRGGVHASSEPIIDVTATVRTDEADGNQRENVTSTDKSTAGINVAPQTSNVETKDLGSIGETKSEISGDHARTSSVDNVVRNMKQFSESVDALTRELLETCKRLEKVQPASPKTYRVLAYDASSQQVVMAETTSSAYSSQQRMHPTEVLQRLNNPAKFLPFFAQLRADGYEIVSGGGDILVFSRISPWTRTTSENLAAEEPAATTHAEPAAVAAGSAAHREAASSAKGTQSPSESSSSQSQGGTAAEKSLFSAIPQALRRILLTGFGMAGTFYAIGVVCEYFRTGGNDGLGPEGYFTAFEMDRKKRD